jgi:phosphorylated CTD-interacting factor 1
LCCDMSANESRRYDSRGTYRKDRYERDRKDRDYRLGSKRKDRDYEQDSRNVRQRHDDDRPHRETERYHKYTRRQNESHTDTSKPSNQKPEQFYDQAKIDPNSTDVPTRNNIPLWNFSDDIQYNVVLKDKQEKKKNLVTPELEYKRAQEIIALRTEYENDCKELLFGMEAPKESFNRWLFEQLSIPKSSLIKTEEDSLDPLLCLPESVQTSSVIRAEILAEIPGRIRYRTAKQAKSSLINYLNNGNTWLIRLHHMKETNKEAFEKAHKIIDDAQQWFNQQPKWIQEEDLNKYKEQLEKLKNECSPIFEHLMSDLVNKVCTRLAEKGRASVEKLSKLKVEKSKKVTISFTTTTCIVMYGDGLDSFEINIVHYNKLHCLYNLHNEPNEDSFKDRLYVLLRRYQTFFGPSELEGGNFHAALPEGGFDLLRRNMQVCQEVFASPFNCYFKHFCSAFPDTDVFFGSRGSFFDFEPVEGSFECGPPYTIEVMDRCAEHCIKLLESSDRPLSFVVFVPEWTDTRYGRIMHPDNCKFCVGHFLADKDHHRYVTGLQHLAVNSINKTNHRYWTLPFPTHVYFLQNEAGRSKWPVTKDITTELKKIMESA